MENKTAAILVLAVVATLIVTASGAYAMGRGGNSAVGPYAGTTYRSGMGPSMMGGSAGYPGGMMGGHGMMGAWNGTSPMYHYMQNYSQPYAQNYTRQCLRR